MGVPRTGVVEQFPVEIREKIDAFIGLKLSPRSIYEWLSENVYPRWREEGRDNLCVTRKTIYNYMRNRCPENLVVSDSYLRAATERVEDGVDTLEKIRGNIATLERLLSQFDLKVSLNMPQISQARLLTQALLDANLKLLELEIRLGLREAKDLEKDEENVLDRLRREAKEREEKALSRVVEP